MHPPLITIIVAVFNGEKTLQQCIDSIAQQTYLHKELIVIDGGSTDGTVELLKKNRKKLSYWISEPDRGIYHAWNKGLEQANGEWICFLGADDYFWGTQVLAQMEEQMKILPSNIRVAYGKVVRFAADGQIKCSDGEPWPEIKEQFKQFMNIPHPGAMHRRSLFEEHGNFNESFRISGDYEFLLRELITDDAAFFPDITAVGVRFGGISTARQNYLPLLREVSLAQRMHGRIIPGRLLLNMFAREYVRLLLLKVLGERLTSKMLNTIRFMRGLQRE